MRKVPKAVYLSADELDRQIADLQADADAAPDGRERQDILKQIAQMRMYADAKRWIESPGLKPVK
jgi:hypothetical protein